MERGEGFMDPIDLSSMVQEPDSRHRRIEWLSPNAFKILWMDDHESEYSLDFLRLNCPCAVCKGHGIQEYKPLPPELKAAPKESAPPATFTPVGRYAVGIIFSDGHATGIFSYRFLRRFCPCAECRPEVGESSGE